MLVRLARAGRAAPSLHRAAIVLDDPALEIADEGRDRQQFEDFVGGAQRLLQRHQQRRNPRSLGLDIAHSALLHDARVGRSGAPWFGAIVDRTMAEWL